MTLNAATTTAALTADAATTDAATTDAVTAGAVNADGTPTAPWAGGWVGERLGIGLRTTHAPVGVGLTDLLGLAVRRNPRRAHLLVSTVLGKHVPTDPRLVRAAGQVLGSLVARALADGVGGAVERDALAPDLLAALTSTTGTVPGPGGDRASVRHPEDAEVDAAARLGERGAALARGTRDRRAAAPDGAVVLGYAETATALGHVVADTLAAPYLHSTRRAVPGVRALAVFEEPHSHATSHLLLPSDADVFTGSGPLVLVDDELSTGRTALNTIEALHRISARQRYVVAALVDLRSAGDRELWDRTAASLGARIDVVALAAGVVELPAGVLEAGARLVEQHSVPDREPVASATRASATEASGSGEARNGAAGTAAAPTGTVVHTHRADLVELGSAGWPAEVREGARHGAMPADDELVTTAVDAVAREIARHLPGPDGRVLVLGFEELMHAPLRIAARLADLVGPTSAAGATSATGTPVRFSTTTRSPVLAVDAPDYAIRTVLTFPSHDDPDDGPGPRFAYNVAPGADASRRFTDIVLVLDDAADTPGLRGPDGLLARLAPHCDRVLVVTLPVTVPSAVPSALPVTLPVAAPATGTPIDRLPEPLLGPGFGSYAPDEVAWLLTDLSAIELEAPTEEREEAIQSGAAHYAESLPVEYQPDEEYTRLFHASLDESADRIALAVGVVTEIVLAERGPGAVLVSLARAGTPVGILMRRWARYSRGLDLDHYAVSIVRGRGIDTVALRYLAAHHSPSDVVFVDGWTGKGAISRELTVAIELANRALDLPPETQFNPDLAVLADPGGCAPTFGTREDYLIPSACLNSTVSGLVSRTVLNDALIGPHDFHGAKFYRELAVADVSGRFLDAVTARFADVAAEVASTWPIVAAGDRAPTWSGWAAVERISAEYGIGNVNLVKPGVGETTRVLLRRVPWKVLVRPGVDDALAHVRVLAERRGVEVVEVDDLPFSCVGLIHPGFSRTSTPVPAPAPGSNRTDA